MRALQRSPEAPCGFRRAISLDAVFCGPSTGGWEGHDHDDLRVLAKCSSYGDLAETPLADIDSEVLRRSLVKCLAARLHVFDAGAACLHLGRSPRKGGADPCRSPRPATGLTRRMVEVLCVNLGVGFENVVLFERLQFLPTMTRSPAQSQAFFSI